MRRARVPVALPWLACLLLAWPRRAAADEGGAGFWVPGQVGSFVAQPVAAGWSLPVVYFHANAAAGAEKHFTRGGHIVGGIDDRTDLVYVTPTYTLSRPLAGAQAAASLSWAFGGATSSVSATLAGAGGGTATAGQTGDVTGGCDLAPQLSLKWSEGAHSGMAYVTANVPTGSYDVNRLANLGLHHWAWDLGGAYTYADETRGRELSATLGLTWNAENPATDYRNGIDGHLDWELSKVVSKPLRLGGAGYLYQQLTADTGAGALLGEFKSSAVGLGPEVGYSFQPGARSWDAELKVYWDLAAADRPAGWNLWMSTSIPIGPPGSP
jgi:hypothetical protein